MFWSRKKAKKPVEKEINKLRDNCKLLWEENFLLQIVTTTNIDTHLSNERTVTTNYDCKLTFLYKNNNFSYLHIEKELKSKDYEQLTIIEELCLLLGKHAVSVIYKVDSKELKPIKIYNYQEILNCWKKDKAVIEATYTGLIATNLIATMDAKISNETLFTEEMFSSFPNGLLLTSVCATYKKNEEMFPLKLNTLPNGKISFEIAEIYFKEHAFVFNQEITQNITNEKVRSLFLINRRLSETDYQFFTKIEAIIKADKRTKKWNEADFTITAVVATIYSKNITIRLTAKD